MGKRLTALLNDLQDIIKTNAIRHQLMLETATAEHWKKLTSNSQRKGSLRASLSGSRRQSDAVMRWKDAAVRALDMKERERSESQGSASLSASQSQPSASPGPSTLSPDSIVRNETDSMAERKNHDDSDTDGKDEADIPGLM